MADSSRTIMTDAGFALETRVRADETKMQFTRATISTDDHFSDTDDALAKLTELSNIQQDGKVTAVQVINTTTVYVQVDVNQAESKADYQMRSAALYAKDDDGTEVLYGVTVLQDPVFVHKDADGSYLGFGINTTVGRASNVVVVVDPANMVTQQVFESTMKNYYTKAEVDAKFVTDDDFASKLPKNIATTDAANTFAKSQTLAGGATDGKGNAYATTKDVATGLKNGFNTKVNVSDMRKPANDVAGIDEVNTKQDKIGYTPADDSKVAHLSGANNFDTTPTVNNNPLLLASSLPSDLARTSQQTNFTDGLQKGGKDVATVDDVSAKQDKLEYTPANAANVVDRNPNTGVVSTPTDFTKLTVNGGKSVATSDDLKSLEDSAWRPIISNSYSGLCMMKYNADTETMSLSGTIFPKTFSTEGSRVAVIIPMPEGFSMGENANSKTNIWQIESDNKLTGTLVDLNFENDGIHIIFDKTYTSYKMFIILDGFFDSSTVGAQSSSFINFKVTKN